MSAPTEPSARLASLDVLRGVALLGVFVENAQHFFSPTYRALVARPGSGLADHAALWLIQIAFENKIYALFALLFGYGIALQMARTGPRFVALHLSRMAILFLIGVFHLTLLWSGDILATYALLGVLLLPFRARATRVLVRTAGVALAAPTLALAAITAAAPALATGAIANARVAAAVVEFGYPVRQALFAFAMFLLGLAAARARGQPDDPLPALRRRLPVLLAVGLAGSFAFVALVDLSGASIVSWTAVLAEACVAIAGPALALGLCGVGAPRARAPALAARARAVRRRRPPLAHELSDAVADRCRAALAARRDPPARRHRAQLRLVRAPGRGERRAWLRASASAPPSGPGARSAMEDFPNSSF